MLQVFSALCVEKEQDGVSASDLRSAEFVVDCLDPSLAVQSQEEEANINTIVRRFGLDRSPVPEGGFMTPGKIDPVTDVVEFFDLREALEQVRVAQASFAALSARVRARFENDPVQFVAFCQDPANLDEMRELGLAVPKPKDEVLVVAPVAVPKPKDEVLVVAPVAASGT